MRKKRYMRPLLSGFMLAMLITGLGHASAALANISHSYQSAGSIAQGSLVTLDPNRTNYVEAADSSNGQGLVGIAVNSSDSLLAVDADSAKIQVATSGTASALVSTLNGTIANGGPVSVSPFSGIGMKATAGAHVVGLAETAFSDKTAGAVQRQIKDKNGVSHSVWVGFVPVSIAVGTDTAPAGGAKLNSLQKLIKSLTGHTISTARIILSLIVAFIALAILITFIHASIYGGLVSIGRNPLAKHAVFHVLVYIIGMAVLTAGVATVVIFLLLK